MLENIEYVGLWFAAVLLGLDASWHFTACRIKDKSMKPCLYKQIGMLKQTSDMMKLATTTIHDSSSIITKLINDCYNESDIDNKVQILYQRN